MKKQKLRRILCIAAGILMSVQILSGFCWMAMNITNIPIFGDSTEYYELSQTLMVDEYRPILYPLLIRICTKISSFLPLEYQTLLYLGQTFLSFLGSFYLTYQVGSIAFSEIKKNRKRQFLAGTVFVSLYLLCIPMITFMNFSVLTDSIATSMLLVAVGAVAAIFHRPEPYPGDFALIAVSMLVEYTIRADRLYTCTLFLIISFCVYLFKRKKTAVFRRAAALSLAAVLLSTGLAAGVNRLTQHPGLYDRIPTTFGFVLLDRIVWPNMRANYADFPEEIKSIITKKEAKTFDEHNNNVMYQMAPLIRERAGEERAEEIYKEMAAIVFRNQTGKVILDIAEDILCVIFTPVSAFFSLHDLADTADSWNLHCVSQNSPAFSSFYYSYYLYTFMVCFVLAFLCAIRRCLRSFVILAPGFLLCLIIALWFSIGDGAPPNDRYALLHYVIWTLWLLLQGSSFCHR